VKTFDPAVWEERQALYFTTPDFSLDEITSYWLAAKMDQYKRPGEVLISSPRQAMTTSLVLASFSTADLGLAHFTPHGSKQQPKITID
jgi:hypothetical protein